MGKNRQQTAVSAKEIHRQNIQRSLEHRLQVAKDGGDEQLVRQLEAEMAYYA